MSESCDGKNYFTAALQIRFLVLRYLTPGFVVSVHFKAGTCDKKESDGFKEGTMDVFYFQRQEAAKTHFYFRTEVSLSFSSSAAISSDSCPGPSLLPRGEL